MSEMRVVVASENPVKLRAVEHAFRRMFPDRLVDLESLSVRSGVNDQPHSDAETFQGALNRARAARSARPLADLWVGIEGGVAPAHGGLTAFAWVIVLSDEVMGRGRTGTFFLPEAVAQLVREGRELGEADDIVFGREDSKREEGAIGLLTGNVIDRARLYEHGVVMALVPFKNPALYRAP